MSFTLLGILNSQAAGGGAGAYDLLESTILTSSASTVTFSGLGAYSDYKHLQIKAVTRATASDPDMSWYVRANGDSTSNKHTTHRLEGNGSSVSSVRDGTNNKSQLGRVPASYAPSGAYGASVIDILDFSSTNKNTTFRSLNGYYSSSTRKIQLVSGAYFETNAITSLEFSLFSGDFDADCRFSLFGVKG